MYKWLINKGVYDYVTSEVKSTGNLEKTIAQNGSCLFLIQFKNAVIIIGSGVYFEYHFYPGNLAVVSSRKNSYTEPSLSDHRYSTFNYMILQAGIGRIQKRSEREGEGDRAREGGRRERE